MVFFLLHSSRRLKLTLTYLHPLVLLVVVPEILTQIFRLFLVFQRLTHQWLPQMAHFLEFFSESPRILLTSRLHLQGRNRHNPIVWTTKRALLKLDNNRLGFNIQGKMGLSVPLWYVTPSFILLKYKVLPINAKTYYQVEKMNNSIFHPIPRFMALYFLANNIMNALFFAQRVFIQIAYCYY